MWTGIDTIDRDSVQFEDYYRTKSGLRSAKSDESAAMHARLESL